MPLMATECSSGCMKMFEREIRTDPITNYLFKRLQRDGLVKYEVVIAFCGGPCYAVEVELVNVPTTLGLEHNDTCVGNLLNFVGQSTEVYLRANWDGCSWAI